jgi:hypothetical protein
MNFRLDRAAALGRSALAAGLVLALMSNISQASTSGLDSVQQATAASAVDPPTATDQPLDSATTSVLDEQVAASAANVADQFFQVPLHQHTPTPTRTTTATPTATTTLGGTGSTTAPLCDGQNGRPAHDPTKWHPLVARNPNGSVLCTYGHDHGMDPSTVNDIFGPVPLSQNISYPWQTVSSSGVPENGPDYKHRVYKWLVGRDLPCSLNSDPQGGSKMITAFRLEAHADGNLGASVRFHSFWVQMQVTDCATGNKGQISFGGHEDFARLTAGNTLVPLPVDPPPGCILAGDTRQEGALNAVEQSNSVWYGSLNRASTGSGPCDDTPSTPDPIQFQYNLGTDGWGPVDPNNPTAFDFYSDRASHRGTQISTDALTLWISGYPSDSSGKVNVNGFIDRHGNRVSTCAPVGQDCIPISISNAEPGAYGVNLPFGAVGYDGDVLGPNGQPAFYCVVPSPDR